MIAPVSGTEIVLLIAAILGFQALLWTVIVRPLRRRARRAADGLAAELANEPPLCSEHGVYRGGTGEFSGVAGNALIALTRRRLLVRKLVGRDEEVAVSDITGVREAKVFRGAVRGGHTHVVVSTKRGELAFFVSDNAVWLDAIRQLTD